MKFKVDSIEINDINFWNRGFIINWSANIGFGELRIWEENGKFYVDTEYIGKDFAKQVLNALVDKAEAEYKE